MRRILSISFICAAVATILAAHVVPHHHHGAEPCVAVDMYYGGETCGDDHPQDSEDAEHSGGCIVDTPFIDPSERNDKCAECASPACGHDGHIHLYAMVSLCRVLLPDEPTATTDYGEPVIRYSSVDLFTGGGLRAPPAVLC